MRRVEGWLLPVLLASGCHLLLEFEPADGGDGVGDGSSGEGELPDGAEADGEAVDADGGGDGEAVEADGDAAEADGRSCGNGEREPGEECDGDPPRGCTAACGSAGSQACLSCAWGACAPPAETCNGADDDCDTLTDDGFACAAGSTSSCATDCRTAGTRVCSDACGWDGECVPPPEDCNGQDDDCDTLCDQDWGCCAGAEEACTTSCGTPGRRLCSAACVRGLCCAEMDVCGNGCDDDCDTLADDGCSTGCTACPGAVDVSAGGRFTAMLAAGPSGTTGSCGGAGAEVPFTFTITAPRDVFLSTHGSAFDTVLYVRGCRCAGAEAACNDDADGQTTSLLVLRDLAAGSYQVFVDSRTGAGSGEVRLHAYLTEPGAAGDRCGDPLPLPSGGETRDSCAYSHDYLPDTYDDCDPGTGAAGGGEDVVYYFLVPTARSVRFALCGSESYCPSAGCLDSVVYLREVCTGRTPQVTCADDECGYRTSGVRIQSDTGSVSLAPGIYYLVVDGYGSPAGTWYHCGNYALVVTGL